MELLDFLWNILVTSALLYGFAQVWPRRGVVCEDYVDALKVATIYAVFYRILFRLAVLIGIFPSLLIGAIPILGWIVLVVAWLAISMAVAAVSLYLADQFVDGFEIEDFPTAAALAFAMGAVRLGWALLF